MKTIRKTIIRYLGAGVMVLLLGTGCVDYLNKAPEVTLTANDVFTKFISFQGFVEDIYQNVVDVTIGTDAEMNWNYGDDVVCTYSDMIEPHFARGDYWKWTHWKQSPFQGFYGGNNSTKRKGYYQNGWYGIRCANIGLANLDRLVGTQEEKDIIEGQCRFFRGYYHWEILRSWGGIPYIDTVFAPSDLLQEPRLTYFETADRITADLTRAAELLPASWDETTVGQTTLGSNAGRITKGAVYGIMGMNYLYAASPLANGTMNGGDYTYNVDLCKQAATAFNEVIKLADQGYFKLETWANYRDVFYTMTGKMTNSNPEIVFSNPIYMYKRWNYGEWLLPALGGWGTYAAVTSNYVDYFGMANGLPIDAAGSGYDPAHPWDNRDPRFYYNIVKDGDLLVQNVNNADKYAQFFVGGRHRQARDGFISFGHRKFINVTCNQFDNGWGNNFYLECSHLRLADVYLGFAEAANEAYDPNVTVPGSNLTAVQAVNKVRERAGVPPVNAQYTGSKEAFREIIRQERAAELAFESHRWFDLRRWHIAHEPQYKEKYNVEFDQAHTYFRKVLVKTSVFDMKHYWLPFPVNQVTLYPGFPQNPGW